MRPEVAAVLRRNDEKNHDGVYCADRATAILITSLTNEKLHFA
jgi:hypothetical protein